MMRHSDGFTLLEAIVALAIMAAAGLALFVAMSQSMQMLQRAERARALDSALRDALALAERIDPVTEPRGARTVQGYALRWSASPVEPPRDGVTGHLQPGLYEIGLYRMRLELWRDGVFQREVEIRRAAWRQVRQPIAP